LPGWLHRAGHFGTSISIYVIAKSQVRELLLLTGTSVGQTGLPKYPRTFNGDSSFFCEWMSYQLAHISFIIIIFLWASKCVQWLDLLHKRSTKSALGGTLFGLGFRFRVLWRFE